SVVVFERSGLPARVGSLRKRERLVHDRLERPVLDLRGEPNPYVLDRFIEVLPLDGSRGGDVDRRDGAVAGGDRRIRRREIHLAFRGRPVAEQSDTEKGTRAANTCRRDESPSVHSSSKSTFFDID